MKPRGLSSLSLGGGSASSLTDLFATDALLDALGAREPARSAVTETPEIRLLRALVAGVDSDIRTDLEADVDPIAVAALAAGFELAGSTEPNAVGAPAAGGSSWHRSLRARATGTSRLQLVGGTAGRRLRRYRPYRLVSVVAGMAIALGGGSLAAAATTDPTHAWGPLRPLAGALHPGWQADFFAAKRDAIMRTLDRATAQSQAGDRVAAAVTYGTAKQQVRDLPSGPDAGLQAKFNAVAAQLGLTQGGQASTAAPSPVVGPSGGTLGDGSTGSPATDPSAAPPVDSAPPPGGDPSADPGSTSGGSADPSTPSDGATTGSTPDPAAPPAASPSPAPSPVPTDPSSGSGSDTGSGSISGSTSGSTSGAVDGSTSGSISGATDSSGSTGSTVTGQPSSGSTAVDGSTKTSGSTGSTASTGSTSSTDTASGSVSGPGPSTAPTSGSASAPSDPVSSSGDTALSGSATGAASATASDAEPAEASAPTA